MMSILLTTPTSTYSYSYSYSSISSLPLPLPLPLPLQQHLILTSPSISSYPTTCLRLRLRLRRRQSFSFTQRPAGIKGPTPRHALLSHDAHLIQDAGVTSLVIAGGYALVSLFDALTYRHIISQNLSRKLVHILSGLFFVASWPLFSSATEARYFASLAPLANGLRLLVYGLSLATDKGLVKSVTREGKPEELLRGPLYYVLVLALCTVVFWRDSPVGLISLAMMSGGDGIADIMGRKFGVVKIPYNQKKSWAGSISMFTFGLLTSLAMLFYFSALGYFQLDWIPAIKRVALISFIASVVESLPIEELIDDNISVPLAAIVTAYMCFSL